MSTLRKEIRYYIDGLLTAGADIVHRDAAQDFVKGHGDVIGFHIEGIVADYIVRELKARSQEPAKTLGQGVLFHGLPAAITIADGVTRPIRCCTRADLTAGREFKVGNIAAARAALKAYDQDLARLMPLMDDDSVTVEDVAQRLGDERSA